eukprot:TRINITY_DN42960_c0_g1_i1.p1 TRINITY_DN42960_c0_g1~~TRINITY_DN42960_c0_g1_i1.p1  ORF type:complete len:572 (-),score=78.25 TRINITY_DN42960_c0_g1_i1:112-1827(-)
MSKVVVASGYFDPLHSGHIEYLQRSKELGSTLIVIINNDRQALLVRGGSTLPVSERVKVVRSLGFVDAVIESMDEDNTVCKTLASLHADLFANGGPQSSDSAPEAGVCLDLGIKMIDGLGQQIPLHLMDVSGEGKKQRLVCASSVVSKARARDAVQKKLQATGGVILAASTLVHREMYNGRNVLAPNSGPAYADKRGYVPVERWIMSKTVAENPITVEGEGISMLLTQEGEVRLDDACDDHATEFLLFGPYSKNWPLTKVLDIGGELWQPSFAKEGDLEVPPVPAHVHPGYAKNGVCCMKEGKLEAYFFPPVDESTVYAGKVANPDKVITRLGLRPEVTREEVRAAMDNFGKDDSMYGLMKVYPIEPNTSWTIQPGMIHAPGPWPTFEIQRAQDDAHLLAWKLGQPVRGKKILSKIWSSNFKKELADADAVMDQAVHFKGSRDPKFQEKWFRQCNVLETGAWGSRRRIFFHEFDGDGLEILPGGSFVMPARDGPYAALVWSGRGELKAEGKEEYEKLDLMALTSKHSEFLVTPQTAVRITNTSKSRALLIYTVLPISDKQSWFVAPEDWKD